MNARDALQRLSAERSRGRLLLIGLAASAAWLLLAGLFAALSPEGDAGQGGGWLIWTAGFVMPLALIWLAVWSARSLSLLRQEAEDLRALLAQMQEGGAPAHQAPPHGAPAHAARMVDPRPAASGAQDQPAAVSGAARMPARRLPPSASRPAAAQDGRQASLQLDSPAMAELTAPELYFALNFPDGPEDREAIRCLRLALSDPGMARLIRAAQDVVTLLAGQGVYMDELRIPETDPDLWHRFAEGARGEAVSGLAVIGDEAALQAAGAMLRSDEVFRDVAHHFLRHFDRLLNRKAQDESPELLAVLAETRSGRAFLLLAQVTGMLGHPQDQAPDQTPDQAPDQAQG